MKQLNIGVIGTGGRGRLARHAHKPEQGSVVVACCDVSEEVLEKTAEWYGDGVFVTREIGDLLGQELDAVMICSPDWLHEVQACAALETGTPLFLEKPMAITIEGCDRILETAKRTGTKLFIGFE